MEQRSIQPITSGALDELLDAARSSPRLRAIRRLHAGDWEHAHRMLNALARGTYVCPHRHPDPHQGEGFILLRGRLALLVFDDEGRVEREASRVLSSQTGVCGMELPPLTWHGLVALEDSVIYEVKGQPAGGYVQARDKEFAPWAPAEGAPGATAYLRELEQEAVLLG